MALAETEDWIKFMELSLSYIKHYDLQINKKIKLEKEISKAREKLHYHIFSFSQLAYALKAHLINKNPSKEQDIEQHFSFIKELANEWKHPDFFKKRKLADSPSAFNVVQKISVEPDKSVSFTPLVTVMKISKIEQMLPQQHHSGNTDIPIPILFENFLKNTKTFCEDNNWI